MTSLSTSARIDLSIDITWEKDGITHKEHYFADQFNCWRDIIPGSLFEKLLDSKRQDTISVELCPGELVPEHRSEKVIVLPLTRLNSSSPAGRLTAGRFYPQGLISGAPGIFKGNLNPFRCVALHGDRITADLNHPLAGTPVIVEMTPHGNESLKPEERGGGCTDWFDIALSGPGMQARYNRQPTNFFSEKSFDRKDSEPDSVFYATDRFVRHIDSKAQQNLTDIYRTLLHPGEAVLDLMAGWESHLPGELQLSCVHGLGLNASELAKNSQLTEHTVQDLNRNSRLSFKDRTFNAVICSLSVEYLVDPIRLFKEVARVLKPGGIFAVSFSNRWFPEKAVRIWEGLHDFERMGLVTEYFLESGRYDSISTASMRGYPRPDDDKYSRKFRFSDPVYAVIGRNKK
ncbi:class I SAM-dependent methyltransferase [Desulfobacula sp.]|uniref:class I SAM-dependent methyltransferase n=1 Tax=Desulfobacula sp. TaxID=2593537 RepID=UPI00261D483F|nr:class I SAM-dependent methyltransferase [Desulfobacula sp.]